MAGSLRNFKAAGNPISKSRRLSGVLLPGPCGYDPRNPAPAALEMVGDSAQLSPNIIFSGSYNLAKMKLTG